MGQAYSAKPKQNRKNRNIQPGNFIIVVDPDDIFDGSVLEEPSIVTVNASYTTIHSQLPLEKIMSKKSFPTIINLREDEKIINTLDNLSNNSALDQQPQLHSRKSSKYKKRTDSEIELSSLSLSQQQRREEKIKKVCTCKFIITSDISNHDQTLQEKLIPSESYIGGFSERISDDDIYKSISEQVSACSIDLPNSTNNAQLSHKRANKNSAKLQNPDNPNSPGTAFYKYENSKITMLSSVLRIPTQERLRREIGGPLPEKTNHKETLARHSSESLNDYLDNKDEHFTCPFCGATGSSLLSPENFAKLSSLKPSKTFFTKPTADDEPFIGNRESSFNSDLLRLREATKRKAIQGELAKSKLLKKTKASSANFVSPTRDDTTSTPPLEKSREGSTNIFSEKVLSRQYTPEKLYISLKRTENPSKKSREQDKYPPKSIMKTPYDCPKTAECCKEEPEKQILEQDETTDDSSSVMDEPMEFKFSKNSLLKSPPRPKESYDSFNQNLKRFHEKKTRSVTEKPQGEGMPQISSSHVSAKSVQSKLDKLTLHSVNKSSFRPHKVSYAPDVCCEPPSKEENLEEKRLEKPSKIIVEISGSVLPKNIMEQLTKSRLKTYISPQGALAEELLKPLTSPSYQETSPKQSKEVTNNQNRSSHKSSIPRKTTSTPPEPKPFNTSQYYEVFSENENKLATSQLTQTNDSGLPKDMKKHLKKSQVFLSTTKPQPLRNISQTFFEELHQFPKQMRLPQTIVEKPACCGRLHQQFAEKIAIEEEGSVASTSRESIPSQVSDHSELSARSFASDASDASQLSTSIKKTKSKRSDPYEYRMMLKKKNMLNHVKEHLSKIKEVSPNGSHKSLTSSTSDVSLTLKEKQVLDKQSLSDQSLRKNQNSPRHKSQLNELDVQKKQRKQIPSSPSAESREKTLSSPKSIPKQRPSGRSKFSEVTKDQDTTTKDLIKHRSKQSHLSLDEAPSLEDFREPSVFQQKQFQEIEIEGVRKATGEPGTSLILPPSPSPKPRRASILKQNEDESKSNKSVSPVTFRRACHTEIHFPDESDPEIQMICRSNPSDSELSQILEEPSEEEMEETIRSSKLLCDVRSSEKFFVLPSDEEIENKVRSSKLLHDMGSSEKFLGLPSDEEIENKVRSSKLLHDMGSSEKFLDLPSDEEIGKKVKPSKLLNDMKSSEKFLAVPSATSFYDLWKYEEDPSAKFIQVLEKRYNRKFNTIDELIEKPPKELILFIKKGDLVETPEVIQPIKHPIDYKDFLSSMTSGV